MKHLLALLLFPALALAGGTPQAVVITPMTLEGTTETAADPVDSALRAVLVRQAQKRGVLLLSDATIGDWVKQTGADVKTAATAPFPLDMARKLRVGRFISSSLAVDGEGWHLFVRTFQTDGARLLASFHVARPDAAELVKAIPAAGDLLPDPPEKQPIEGSLAVLAPGAREPTHGIVVSTLEQALLTTLGPGLQLESTETRAGGIELPVPAKGTDPNRDLMRAMHVRAYVTTKATRTRTDWKVTAELIDVGSGRTQATVAGTGATLELALGQITANAAKLSAPLKRR